MYYVCVFSYSICTQKKSKEANPKGMIHVDVQLLISLTYIILKNNKIFIIMMENLTIL